MVQTLLEKLGAIWMLEVYTERNIIFCGSVSDCHITGDEGLTAHTVSLPL